MNSLFLGYLVYGLESQVRERDLRRRAELGVARGGRWARFAHRDTRPLARTVEINRAAAEAEPLRRAA